MPAYNLSVLGPIVAPQNESAAAYAVNAQGHAVGFAQVGAKSRAVVWSPDQHTLPTDSGYDSCANAINASGQIVGTSSKLVGSDYVEKPWFYDGTTMHDLAAELGWTHGLAYDINDDGLIALYNGQKAYLYDSKQDDLFDLGSIAAALPGADYSIALALNALGHAVGMSGWNGFLFKGSLVDLGPVCDLYAGYGWISGVSASDVIVGRKAGESTGFICDAAGASLAWTQVSALSGSATSDPMAINSAGDVVGYCSDGDWEWPTNRAFVRVTSGVGAGQTIALDECIGPSGSWSLTEAMDISDSGVIVGRGLYQGTYRAFLLTPVGLRRPDGGDKPPWMSRRVGQELAIDPMARVLFGKAYLRWVEWKHPHEPKVRPTNGVDGLEKALVEIARAVPNQNLRAVRSRIGKVNAIAEAVEKALGGSEVATVP